MREYQLYIIEEEFAAHYFGRERMFFQLFSELSAAGGVEEDLLSKQVRYITREIPTLRVQQLLKRQLSKRSDFSMEKGIFRVEASCLSFAEVVVCDRYLHLRAKGSYEAEAIFFEVLRQWERFFLAVDFTNERFGWLNPIKERQNMFKNSNPLLYNEVSFSTL